MLKIPMNIRLPIFVLVSVLALAACEKFDNTSIIGKWECSPNQKYGWLIEFKSDGRYMVIFRDGKKPWEGKYEQAGSKITYTPDVPSESTSEYLPEEVQAIDKVKRSAVLAAKPGVAPNLCRLQ